MPNQPKQILYLVNAYERDAPTRLAAAVAEAAASTGRYTCAFAALSRAGDFQGELRDRVGPAEYVALRSPLDAGGWRRLWRTMSEHRPDLVHTTLVRPTLFGVPVARLAGVPHVVITQHGVHEWREGGAAASAVTPAAFRAVARQADAIVTVSNAACADLRGGGIPDGKLRVIANGVDARAFAPGARSGREALMCALFPGEQGSDLQLVGAAGNLRTVKGHATLVEAAARMAGSRPSVRFAVWGEGPDRAHLEQMIAALHMTGRFVLPGHLADPAPAIASCDVFVQPSVSESFGIAAAEAMSCGVAVVASAVGGLPELVVNGVTGLLVQPGDSTQLAAALESLLDDADTRNRMGQAGRQRVLDYYPIERTLQAYVDLYDEMTGQQT